MREVFGPKEEEREIIGRWRRLHKGQLRNLYCTYSIIRVSQSMKTVRLVTQVVCMISKPHGGKTT